MPPIEKAISSVVWDCGVARFLAPHSLLAAHHALDAGTSSCVERVAASVVACHLYACCAANNCRRCQGVARKPGLLVSLQRVGCETSAHGARSTGACTQAPRDAS